MDHKCIDIAEFEKRIQNLMQKADRKQMEAYCTIKDPGHVLRRANSRKIIRTSFDNNDFRESANKDARSLEKHGSFPTVSGFDARHPSHSTPPSPVASRKNSSNTVWSPVSTETINSTFLSLAKKMVIGEKDTSYTNVSRSSFLLCYRSYASGAQMYTIWYKIYQEALSKCLTRIIMNALDFMKEWIGTYYFPDFNRTPILTHFLGVLELMDNDTKMKFKLLILKSSNVEGRATPKLLPKSRMRTLLEFLRSSGSFNKLSGAAAARALTKYEFHLFQNVLPAEFLDQNWQSATKQTSAPNITKLIARFNQVAYWVASEIVTTKQPKKQLKKLEKFIDIMIHCNHLNNFNSMMEIMSGLNHAAVQRLEYLWSGLSDKLRTQFERMEELMRPSQNFALYREELKKRTGPCLPYFGVCLKDVTFVNTALKPYSDYCSYQINCEWINAIYQVINELRKYQSKPYELKADSGDFFAEHLLINHDLVSLDDEMLYKLSLKLLPSNEPVNK